MSRERVRRIVAIAGLVAVTLTFGVAELVAQATRVPQVQGSLGQRKQASVSNDAWPKRLRVYSNDLPAGRARLIAERGCLICHSATLLTQQHKDAAAWQKTIRTMIGWGAPMDTVEGDSLRDWLVQEYGPRK
jgi:hypothetical protein